MKFIALFLNYDGGPIWIYDDESEQYSSAIPEEYLSNAKLVKVNDSIREKYQSLFVYDEETDSRVYVGFKTDEENADFYDELKRFSDLVTKTMGENYPVADAIDYSKFDVARLREEREKESFEKENRKIFLQTKKKAEKGDVEAMRNLAYLYFHGKGTEVDKAKSISWFKKAAKKTDEASLFELGRLYFWGIGVKKNRRSGLSYFAQSARFGYEGGFIAMGDILYYGLNGVKKDKKEAMKWYEEGMEEGFLYCTFALARGYEEEALGEPYYLKSLEYYFKAARKGHAESLFGIGRLYEKGWGVKKDYSRSFFYHRLSASRGGEGGIYGVGRAYMEGLGVAPDPQKAIEKLEQSGRMGYYRALYFLGIYYKLGKGVEQNDEKAFEYFQKAHDNGSWGGDLELGLCYEEGRGCTKNLFKAFGLVKASADMDFAPACFAMGRYYHEGIATKKDDGRALKHLLKAVSKRVKGSYEYLASFYKEKGEDDKARLVMEQKEKDESTPDYVGEYYRHKDPNFLFDFYLENLGSAIPYPFGYVEEVDVDFGPLLLAVISANSSEEVADAVIDHYNHSYVWQAEYETEESRKERIAFYKDILDGKRIYPAIFNEEEIGGKDPYKKAAIAFGEWLFPKIDPEFLDEEEGTREEFVDFLSLLSEGLRFIAEDFREMTLCHSDAGD